MIENYYCPTNEKEIEKLLSEQASILAGGTYISRNRDTFSKVIDIQKLGLDYIKKHGQSLVIGASTKLQTLMESPYIDSPLRELIRREFSQNIRNSASIVGTVITREGTSNLLAWLICAAARAFSYDVDQMPMAMLDISGKKKLAGKFVKEIHIPLKVKIKFDTVSKTPDDLPQVGVFLNTTDTDKYIVVINGMKANPLKMEIEPGNDIGMKIEEKVKNSHSHLTTNNISLSYQLKMINTLITRISQQND